MAILTESNRPVGFSQLMKITRICRNGWEDFSRRRQDGITEETRLELCAMKDVVSSLVSDESDFYKLAQQWERERPHGADILEMVMHPSYQRIIGMGPDVVPLLLKELERKPGHWFWALHAITGANPVLPENQGKLKEMAKAWIDWGKKQGYSW